MKTRWPYALLLAVLLFASLPFGISDAEEGPRQDGLWTSHRMWGDWDLVYTPVIGDADPDHPGNELFVGGETNWTTELWGLEDSWESLGLFEDDWYVNNLAVGNVDPSHDGNEVVTVGRDGNVNMLYKDAGEWKRKLLYWDPYWTYAVLIADFDPRHDGNEVIVGDDLGYLRVIWEDGGEWKVEEIWQDPGKDGYIDVAKFGDFDPDHDGMELVVTGGSKNVTEIYYNGSSWVKTQLWKDELAPIDLEIGDFSSAHPGNELAVAGLANKLKMLYRDGDGNWTSETLFTDSDVIYTVSIADADPRYDGDEIVVGSWSKNLTVVRETATGWATEHIFTASDFIFGMDVGEFDPLHDGNEIVVSDRSGDVTKVQYEPPGFVLYTPKDKGAANAGTSITIDVRVLSRGGFTDPVEFALEGAETGWDVRFKPAKVTPTGRSDLRLSLPEDATPGKYNLKIRGKSGDIERVVDFELTVNPPGTKDFSLEVSPREQSVVADYAATFTLIVQGHGGFDSEVSFAVEGLPSGASARFKPEKLVPTDSAELTVQTISTTPEGKHFITIRAAGGGKETAATVVLSVRGSATPDFTISLAPETIEVVGSRHALVDTNVVSIYNFDGDVDLWAEDLPVDMTATFTPGSVVPTGTVELNISTNASLRTATYYITVYGRSGDLIHGAVLRVDVNTMGVPDFELRVQPEEVTVVASGVAYYNATVIPKNDFWAPVVLDVDSDLLPVDTIVEFENRTLYPFEFVNFSIQTLLSTPPGSYTLNLLGMGSGLINGKEFGLEVDEAKPIVKVESLIVYANGKEWYNRTDEIAHGDEVTFKVTVVNLAGVNATNVFVEVKIDLKVVRNASIDVSAYGRSEFEIIWTAEEGRHEVTAVIVRSDRYISSTVGEYIVLDVGPSNGAVNQLIFILVMIFVILTILAIIGFVLARRKPPDELSDGEKEPPRMPKKSKGKKKGKKKKG